MRLLSNFGVIGDATKDIFVIPRFLLKSVALWPDTLDVRTILYPISLYVLTVLIQAAQLVFFVLNIDDITKMASTVSTLSTNLQAIIKIAAHYVYVGELKELILVMRNDFWSLDLVGVKLERSLKYNDKMVAAAMLFMYSTGLIYGISFVSTPAITGTRELPFHSSYPFNWHESPTYEVVYFLQSYMYIFFVMHGVLGHDDLFYVSVTNCVAQFEILKEVFSKIGSDEIDEINRKLDRYCGREDGSLSGNTKLFYRCIEHHKKLIGVCDGLGRTFTFSIAVQFLGSLTAICVSCYLITVMGLDSPQSTHLFSYAVGNLAQFFFYCIAGNELTYQASTLSTYVFNSRWYESEVPKEVKKAIPVVIQRSQKRQTFTALKMADLNYYTFVKILQLSFSFYTLLSSMNENRRS